jgi:hypothetical protein
MENPVISCPHCQLQVLPVFYFCPNCGKQLRPKPIAVSLGRQLGVYLLSFFFPPLGFPIALRYIKQQNKKTKIIGMISLAVIAVSIGAAVYTYILFVQRFYSLYPQLISGQPLGY